MKLALSLLLGLLPLLSGAETKHILVANDGISLYHQRVAENRAAYTNELLYTILSQHDYEIEFRQLPRKRANQVLLEGKTDCVSLARKPMQGVIFAEEPWGYHELHLYVRAQDQRFNQLTFDDLKRIDNAAIGTISGWRYDDGRLDALIAERQNTQLFYPSHQVDALEQNIEMVHKGHLDGFVACPLWLRGELRDSSINPNAFKPVLELSEEPQGLYLGCSAKSPHARQIIRLVDETIPRLRESGALEQLLVKHGQQDWRAPASPN